MSNLPELGAIRVPGGDVNALYNRNNKELPKKTKRKLVYLIMQ
jgi:hypothetical protein